MGWCSGTEIFDQIAEVVLSDKPMDKKATIKAMIEALENGDWDCQGDSAYWDHPIVKEAFRELHPDWFKD
jgi:hypothetical protein